MLEEVAALGWRKAIQEFTDPLPEAFNGALFVFSQVRFELREGLFNRVQVWGVGRQIAQLGSCGFDGAANILAFVSAEIVHHNGVTRFKGRNEDLVHISLEAGAIHGAVEDHGRGKACASQPGCEGGDFPMAMRRGPSQALAAQRPASEPYHIGGTACFIDEDQPMRIEAGLAFAPALPCASDVRAVLFAGENGFFCN